MTRTHKQRVSSNYADLIMSPEEKRQRTALHRVLDSQNSTDAMREAAQKQLAALDTPDIIDTSTMGETQAPHPSLLRLAALAQRMADRCVRGKYGLALENDARAALDLWDALPEELKRKVD